jgi:hypothetical protein
MKIIATWSGEGFTAKHVQALAQQVERFAPLDDFVCLTPVSVSGVECLPLKHEWRGWWVKFELFRPDIKGTVLYLDLDTVITGSLSDIVAVDKLTLLRDFYRDGKTLYGGIARRRAPKPEGLQASLMLLPEADRAEIWEDWMRGPNAHMQRLGSKGDQPLLEQHFLKHAQRWQDVVPGQIVSWKVDCCGGNEFQVPAIPEDARVIVFHGQPRPWQCKEFEALYA